MFKTVGDTFCAVFTSASGAVAAAVAAQRDMRSAFPEGRAPSRVRMAVHSGEAQVREGDYSGGP